MHVTTFARPAALLRTACLAIGIAACGLAHADDKAVFQVTENDEAKWSLVLANVRNLQRGADGVDVEIVAFGPGIQLLKAGSPLAGRIDEALGARVKVVACRNTMTANRLTEADMLPGIGYVPAGVVEVMRKQQQGYAYLRP